MKMLFDFMELDAVAISIAKTLYTKKVIAFHGQMGAGKTTLIGAICRALGTREVTGSPTFSIINQYNARDGRIIYHMDWYRIKDEEEAINAGIEYTLCSGNLCLVEWPEKAEGLLPDDTFHIAITAIDETTRELSYPEF